MRITILSTLVASVLLAVPAHAETIDEARFVAALEASDPRFARLSAEIAAARADVTTAGLRPNPSLVFDREVPFVDGVGVATSYVRLELPLDISGRRGLRVSAAEATVRGRASEVELAKFQLVVEGLRAFDEAAHARAYLEILTAGRASLVEAVEIARRRAKAGDVAGYDVQRFELELVTYDDRIASAELELRRARMRLATLAGRPGGELDADSALPIQVDLPPLDRVLGETLAARGDYRAAMLRADAGARRIRAGDRGWIPLPSFTAGAVTADLGDRTGTGYVVGLAISLPIFDRGQGERAKGSAELQMARAEARWLETQIPAAVRLAHETLTARIEQANRFGATQLDRLDDMLRAAEAAFREGDAGVVELLDAHRAARETRLRALELRLDVARAKRELELTLGHSLGGTP